jgi:UDP-N-acetylglucosamine acyltransferase
VHQFTRVGKYVMVQGGTRFGKDLPPYITAGREPVCYCGINSIGLRRHGFNSDSINEIQEIYRLVYQSGLNTTDAVAKIEEEIPDCQEKETVLAFIRQSKRGIVRGYV